MKHTIKSIILLTAILIGGAGQAWAGANGEPNLGKIVYTTNHGSLAFYKEEACTTPINTTIDGVYSLGLTPVKDGSDETIGYKVYIQATPDFGYTLEAGDETTGKVSFITAEVTVAGTDVAGARTRRGGAPTVNVGDFIDVTATETSGVYCITMPADKNLNLHITATFKEKSKNTAALRYIDANGETQTKNAGEVYILDGTEISLGKTGETTWYVVNEDINYATYSSANCYLQLNGEVHLILADGKKMTVGKSDNPGGKVGIVGSSYSLTIYGQGGDAEGSLEVNTAKTDYSINLGAVTICGGNVITSQGVTVDEFNIYGGEIEAYCLRSITGGVTISGGQVTLTAPGNAIESNTNITLGWTDPTDFIKVAGSYYCKSGTLSIADGKRFIAYTPGATGSDPMTATAVISGTSGTDFDLSAIEGKVLKPALTIDLPEGVTATGTDVFTSASETAGTYAIYGAEVTLSGTASAGNALSFTVKDADGNEVRVENKNGFIMPATDVTVTATETAIPATAPTISTQPSDLSLTYGYDSDNVLSISASAAEGHTLSYQWYSNNSNSTSGGTAINEATESSYTVPTGMSVGTTYYYCVVTATRSDNSQTATTTTNVATVTVCKVPTEINVSEATIELEVNNEISTGATLTPAEAGNLVYTSSNTSVAEVEEGKIIALGVGTATITVSFAGDDTYEAAESKTIEVTVNPITLTLGEGTGNAGVIDIPGGGSSMEVNLTYNRTLTAPTESNKDMTIGGQAAKLYTTCLPTAPATGDNVKYYILSGVSGKTLNFSEVTSPVADTPYLMAVTGSSNAAESVTGQDVTLKKMVTGANANGFTMMGTQTGLSNADALSTASSGNVTYILQDQDKWGKVVNGDVYIPPFRAFIVGPDVSTNGARLLYSSLDGDATGIQNIRTVDADGTEQWYDLNGRRIAKPTTKGVYIRNGKKTTN